VPAADPVAGAVTCGVDRCGLPGRDEPPTAAGFGDQVAEGDFETRGSRRYGLQLDLCHSPNPINEVQL
jgi:hypothetical protein